MTPMRHGCPSATCPNDLNIICIATIRHSRRRNLIAFFTRKMNNDLGREA